MAFAVNDQVTAPVFNIQPYSIHDGPGIRTTVFLKGCPLRCLWCANPESNASSPELMTYTSRCVGCGACIPVCPIDAISITPFQEKYVALTDRNKCANCGKCVEVCPNNAREIVGKEMTVREVVDNVVRDKLFFDGSGGGITLSGGEPLVYPEFSSSLLAAARAEGIHTAIESSSFARRDVIDAVFAHVDIALLDIKHMDSPTHQVLTGVSNEPILRNIRHVHDNLHVPVILRIPTIPGYNDSPENFHCIGRFAADLGDDIHINLLPYHKLGESKLESLGRQVSLGISPPTSEHMEQLRAIIASYGLSVKIGG